MNISRNVGDEVLVGPRDDVSVTSYDAPLDQHVGRRRAPRRPV